MNLITPNSFALIFSIKKKVSKINLYLSFTMRTLLKICCFYPIYVLLNNLILGLVKLWKGDFPSIQVVGVVCNFDAPIPDLLMGDLSSYLLFSCLKIGFLSIGLFFLDRQRESNWTTYGLSFFAVILCFEAMGLLAYAINQLFDSHYLFSFHLSNTKSYLYSMQLGFAPFLFPLFIFLGLLTAYHYLRNHQQLEKQQSLWSIFGYSLSSMGFYIFLFEVLKYLLYMPS